MPLFSRPHAGVTIIEVVIAVGIFAIGFLAVAGLQIRAVNSATNARVITQALELADARAEFYHALPLYPHFTDTALSSAERFETPAQLAEGVKEITTRGYTIQTRIKDNQPFAAVKNIYTHSADPAMVVVSKTISISVFEAVNPGAILAEMEMVKIWDNDL